MNQEVRDLYEMSLAEIREYRGFSRRELSQQLTGKVYEDTLYVSAQ
jgi:ribosome-binding protein aMBF1 (putative translation factor)